LCLHVQKVGYEDKFKALPIKRLIKLYRASVGTCTVEDKMTATLQDENPSSSNAKEVQRRNHGGSSTPVQHQNHRATSPAKQGGHVSSHGHLPSSSTPINQVPHKHSLLSPQDTPYSSAVGTSRRAQYSGSGSPSPRTLSGTTASAEGHEDPSRGCGVTHSHQTVENNSGASNEGGHRPLQHQQQQQQAKRRGSHVNYSTLVDSSNGTPVQLKKVSPRGSITNHEHSSQQQQQQQQHRAQGLNRSNEAVGPRGEDYVIYDDVDRLRASDATTGRGRRSLAGNSVSELSSHQVSLTSRGVSSKGGLRQIKSSTNLRVGLRTVFSGYVVWDLSIKLNSIYLFLLKNNSSLMNYRK